jgi:hypothetical protein
VNEGDAFRERLTAMNDEELGALYDATATDWAATGLSKKGFLGNMAAKRAYDEAVRPLELAYEAAVSMSDREEIRVAKRTYEESLESTALANPASVEAQDARRGYDDAILAAGDERVIAAKRAYEAAVVAETKRFTAKLR